VANHLRRQIREAVATAVTGLATTGARVFQSRVYPLQRTDLPALVVLTLGQTSERGSLPAPGRMVHSLRLQVVAVAAAVDGLDDELDQICKEVEIALAMPCAALAGIATTITLVSTDIELDGESEQPVGRAAMTFEVVYHAAENAPDVAH
jgi:hypothetical protein